MGGRRTIVGDFHHPSRGEKADALYADQQIRRARTRLKLGQATALPLLTSYIGLVVEPMRPRFG